MTQLVEQSPAAPARPRLPSISTISVASVVSSQGSESSVDEGIHLHLLGSRSAGRGDL
jgi:hypothetical protein